MKSFSALVLCVICASEALAQITIEITQGMDDPTPIAVVPFAGIKPKSDDNIRNIVSNDLQMSGFFHSIPTADMLAFPSSEQDIYYRDWRLLGAAYIVIGRVYQDGELYALDYQLFDVLAQRKVFQKVTKGRAEAIRDIAHAASDQIYEAITNIRGIFSTKMLYVEDMNVEGPTRYRLVKADIDGARPEILFKSSEPLMSPAWSPSMNQVAYVSFETSRPAIFRHDLVSGVREQLTNFRGLNGAPAWSPDGSKLAFVLSKDGNPELYTLDLATKKLTRVTHNRAIDTEPNWSPDGKSLIFTSNRGGSPQIYQIGLASGRVERLTFDGDYNARGRVSPDGRSIVMVHRESGVFHIAWQDIASGRMRVLTETWLDESPTIAPNGAMLLYATQYNNQGVLAAVSMDAGLKFRLPSKKGDVREPAWSPFVN
ncbi:Tol-Pal system beta propeller repeat protein TolB [Agaribacterium haliotis]|uniref:Tol-Pal system beta propeller repeat protein TolB n=1 Tax=Agaribacterium haliotis TaxID=2013869 RepID=UPI000BB5613F|nr:Tol-Pal system beta propeller repeat protein TolB [Agaribacterium haliotis]